MHDLGNGRAVRGGAGVRAVIADDRLTGRQAFGADLGRQSGESGVDDADRDALPGESVGLPDARVRGGDALRHGGIGESTHGAGNRAHAGAAGQTGQCRLGNDSRHGIRRCGHDPPARAAQCLGQRRGVATHGDLDRAVGHGRSGLQAAVEVRDGCRRARGRRSRRDRTARQLDARPRIMSGWWSMPVRRRSD